MAVGSELIRSVVRTLIGVLSLAAFLLILTILNGSGVNETAGKAIGTAVALSFFGLTAISGVFLAERRPDLLTLGYGTAIVSALAFVLVLAAIWLPDVGWRGAVDASIVTAVASQASLLLATARPTDTEAIRLVRAGTILAAGLLALLALVEIASPGQDVGPKPIGVVAVLYLLGDLLLPLMRRAVADQQAPQGNSSLQLLRRHGMVVVEGPVTRAGTYGPGQSVALREPDGTLVELITYEERPS